MDILLVAVLIAIPIGWLVIIIICDLIYLCLEAYEWIIDRLH